MSQDNNNISSEPWMPQENDPSYYKIISEIKDYAIFAMSPEGIILTWNKGCVKLKQWSVEEAVGKHYRMLFMDEDQKDQKPEKEIEYAIKEGSFEEYNWRKKKDGSPFWANVVLSPVYNEKNQIIGLFKIAKDLSILKKIEDELYRKNEQLIKSYSELENFIYSSNIGLKGPIANLENLSITLKHDLSEAEFDQVRDLIMQSVSKLRETLESIVQVSKVQISINEANPENINLGYFINEIKNEFSSERMVGLKTDFKVEEIYFSKANLKIIVYNLISNSIKFKSPDRPCKVEVKSEKSGDYILISFKDNGIGMPQGYKEKLFRMFRRLHDQNEGSAIGLYLVKRVVDQTGGKLDVDSVENEGTEFKIFLTQQQDRL